MNKELREEVARVIVFDNALWGSGWHREEAYKRADKVLAIPAIAEALAISAGFPENDFRDYLLRRGRWEGVSKDAGYV